MILRYIYIQNHNRGLNNLAINLGGSFRFEFDGNKLICDKEEEYVQGIYQQYESIADISAIIGQNGAGKTSILRAINMVLSSAENNLKYIAVFETDEVWQCYWNLDKELLDVDEKKLLKLKMFKLHHNEIIDNIKGGYKVVYFSNIFDKATPFAAHNNLIDISTNSMLKEFLAEYSNIQDKQNKYVTSQLENCLKENKVIDEIKYYLRGYEKNTKYNGNDVLPRFKRHEAMKKLDYIAQMRARFHDEIKLLFDFPNDIRISFADNSTQKLKDLDEIKSINIGQYKKIHHIGEKIDKYILEKLNPDESKELRYKIQFLGLIVYEILVILCLDEIEYVDIVLDKVIEINDANQWGFDDVILELLEYLKGNIEVNDEVENEPVLSSEETKDEEQYEFRGSYTEVLEGLEKLYEYLEEYAAGGIEEEDAYLDVGFYWGEIRNRIKQITLERYIEINLIIDDIELNRKDYKDCTELEEEERLEEENRLDEVMIEDLYKLEGYIKDLSISETKEILAEADDLEEELADFKPGGEIKANDKIQELVTKVGELIALMNQMMKKYTSSIEESMDEWLELIIELKGENTLEFIDKFNGIDFRSLSLVVDHQDLSSGHNAYLDMCCRLNDSMLQNEIKSSDNILLMIDEGDLFLHPEIQIEYMQNLLSLINVLIKDKKVQVILTSNSPFIISDIIHTNIVYLNPIDNEQSIEVLKSNPMHKTFGANINSLLINTFFMKKGIVGCIAKDKINEIISLITSDEEIDENKREEVEKTINLIGEPLIRRKLEVMLYEKVNRKTIVEDEIAYYERKLKYLKELSKNDKSTY